MGDVNVSQTFQIADINDLTTVKTSYTNRLKAPITDRNSRIFDYIDKYKKYVYAGVPLDFPYGLLPKAKIVENGIEVVSNAYCRLFKVTDTHFEFAIYGVTKTFFEKIKELSLQSVYPSNPQELTAINLSQYIDEDNDFLFGMAGYMFSNETDYTGPTPETKLFTIHLSPQFFVKDMFTKIFDYVGYTVEYPIINGASLETTADWKNFVLSAKKAISGLGVAYGDTFDVKDLVPEMSCSQFIKEINVRFNLRMIVDELNKIVIFKNLDEQLKNGVVEDWSDKLHAVRENEYSLGEYAKNNYYEYAEDEGNNLRGTFELIDGRLPSENTVFTSEFEKSQYATPIFIDLEEAPNELTRYYILDLSSPDEIPLQFMYRKKIDIIHKYRLVKDPAILPLTYLDFTLFVVNLIQFEDKYVTKEKGNPTNVLAIVNNPRVSFQKFLDENYPETIKMLNRAQVTSADVYLSVLDVKNLDFFGLIYLKQIGSNFLLNKVSNYQEGKVTKVELIRIPSLI